VYNDARVLCCVSILRREARTTCKRNRQQNSTSKNLNRNIKLITSHYVENAWVRQSLFPRRSLRTIDCEYRAAAVRWAVDCRQIFSALSSGSSALFLPFSPFVSQVLPIRILQVYPSVEYDFVPSRFHAAVGDLLHIQWTGSDANSQGNNGNVSLGTFVRPACLRTLGPPFLSLVTLARIV
jgi:hypothetical protein